MTKTYTANLKNYLFYIIGGIILSLSFASIIGGIKTIAILTPEQDGWTDTDIKNISADLIEIGITRITEKYNDKEVLII